MGHTSDKNIPIKINTLADIDVCYVSAGKFHSSVIDGQKQLYIWGSNKYGQLGIDYKDISAKEPIYKEMSFEIAKVACGYKNTLILSAEGLVYGCGVNGSQQVSSVDQQAISEFTLIEELYNIERIFCTDLMMAMSKDYNLFLWGDNSTDVVKNNKPEMIEAFENNVINASAGSGFVIIIDKNLFVYAKGSNSKGQLGYSDTLREGDFGVIDKLCQNPLKSVTCGKDFVIGLGGIIVPNPNKLKMNESQFNLGGNYTSQINKHGSQIDFRDEMSPKASKNQESGIQKGEQEIFQSFHLSNSNTKHMHKSKLPTFPEGEEDKQRNEDQENANDVVADAVEGFKSEVYSILKDIKTKNPDIDQLIDKDKLKQLKIKEDLLNDIMNSYAKITREAGDNDKDVRNDVIAILEGILKEYNKHITFKGHKKVYRNRLTELKVG